MRLIGLSARGSPGIDPSSEGPGGGSTAAPRAKEVGFGPTVRPKRSPHLHPSAIAGAFPRAVAGALIAVAMIGTAVTGRASPRATQLAEPPAAAEIDRAQSGAHAVESAIAYAAKTPRSSARNGRAPILGKAQARIAEKTWAALDGVLKDAIARAVMNAGSDGERALIVKAMAARSPELLGADRLVRVSAAGEVVAFADAIRGRDPGALMQNTALIDIDETKAGSAFDPFTLEEGVEPPLGASDKDHDGLFQRYEDSCGPTSIEVLLGDLDVIYALKVRTSDITANPAGYDFQRDVLVRYGEDPSSRLFPYYEKKVESAVADRVRAGALSKADADALEAYLFSGKPRPPSAAASIAAIREANGGFPSDGVIRTLADNIPKDPAKKYGRIGLENIRKLLNEKVGSRIGVEYGLESIYQGIDHRMSDDEIERASAAFVKGRVDRLAATLDSGVGVVFSTTWPDHFWSMSAVQGEVGRREFLVHDVWSGRTKWVTEAALIDGSFARQFLGEKKIYTRIDLMYLPDAPR